MGRRNFPDSISRRNLLKLSGTGLALATLPTMSVTAKGTDANPEDVDPDDPETVRRFLENFYNSSDSDAAIAAWSGLTDEQEAAVIEMEEELLTIETEITQNDSDGPSTMAVPRSYSHTVYGSGPTGRLFKFEHTINWSISNGNVLSYSGTTNGNAGGICWNYKGIDNSWYSTGSGYFISHKVGKVRHPCANKTYNPYSYLQGNGSGVGSVVDASSDL